MSGSSRSGQGQGQGQLSGPVVPSFGTGRSANSLRGLVAFANGAPSFMVSNFLHANNKLCFGAMLLLSGRLFAPLRSISRKGQCCFFVCSPLLCKTTGEPLICGCLHLSGAEGMCCLFVSFAVRRVCFRAQDTEKSSLKQTFFDSFERIFSTKSFFSFKLLINPFSIITQTRTHFYPTKAIVEHIIYLITTILPHVNGLQHHPAVCNTQTQGKRFIIKPLAQPKTIHRELVKLRSDPGTKPELRPVDPWKCLGPG